jgi:hypothetical protein
VAPHTPSLAYGSLEFKRQGPIAQCLQQADLAPIGHGFIPAARSKAVSTPSACAFLSICAVDLQRVQSAMFVFFVERILMALFFSMEASSCLWRNGMLPVRRAKY